MSGPRRPPSIAIHRHRYIHGFSVFWVAAGMFARTDPR